MNPQSTESSANSHLNSSGINLPPPVAQSAEQPNFSGAEGTPTVAEQSAMSPEAAGQLAPPQATPQASIPLPQTLPPAAPQTNQAGNDVTPTAKGVVPSVLEDKDLIEKEWVNKAKAIVEKNRDDPYKQSEELTVVRAEYLQKNYNKTIKAGK